MYHAQAIELQPNEQAAPVYRQYRGAVDCPAIAAVFNASSLADHVDYIVTADELAAYYQPTPRFDPDRDLTIVEQNGTVIAYGRVEHALETSGDHVYMHTANVHPAWRQRGIGRALLERNEQRLRALALDHPPVARRWFAVWNMSMSPASQHLLHRMGYVPARYFFTMTRSTDAADLDAPLPPGIEVRSVRPEHYRAIWDAEVEAFRDHWGFIELDEGDYERMLRDPIFDPSLWCVAWDGDQVVGMVRSFIHAEENAAFSRARGYTENISVRQPWRGRGLASALIKLSLITLQERGMTEAVLNVDTENLTGALRLYERCGYEVLQRRAQYRKPME